MLKWSRKFSNYLILVRCEPYMTITVIASSLNLWEGLKIAFSSALFEKKNSFFNKDLPPEDDIKKEIQ